MKPDLDLKFPVWKEDLPPPVLTMDEYYEFVLMMKRLLKDFRAPHLKDRPDPGPCPVRFKLD